MTNRIELAGLAGRRRAAGLTQEQLGAALGLNRATVAMWETGRSMPGGGMLWTLADLLGCSMEELFIPYNDDIPEEVDLP